MHRSWPSPFLNSFLPFCFERVGSNLFICTCDDQKMSDVFDIALSKTSEFLKVWNMFGNGLLHISWTFFRIPRLNKYYRLIVSKFCATTGNHMDILYILYIMYYYRYIIYFNIYIYYILYYIYITSTRIEIFLTTGHKRFLAPDTPTPPHPLPIARNG